MKRSKVPTGTRTRPKAYTVARRIKDLKKLCDPVPRSYRGAFTALGILPHGCPLFADGSTQCRWCKRVMHAEGLKIGYCEGCLRRLEVIGQALDLVKGMLWRDADG